jgi:hypothetical protein
MKRIRCKADGYLYMYTEALAALPEFEVVEEAEKVFVTNGEVVVDATPKAPAVKKPARTTKAK